MRTFFLGLVAAVAMLVSGEVAQAGFVSGGVGFQMETQNADSGTVLDTRSIFDLSKNSGATGDFRPPGNSGFVPNGTMWQSFTLINPMNRLTLSTAQFGTFDGFLVSDSGDSSIVNGNGVRAIIFVGNFLGGTLFNGSGKQGLTAANLTFQLSQSTSGNVLSFNSSISMTASGTAFVPEPASMAIFGIGAIGFAARRFRRK